MSKQKSLEEVLSSRLNLDTIKQNNTKYGKVKNPTLRKNQSPILNTVSHTEERNIEDELYVDQRTIETNDNNFITEKRKKIGLADTISSSESEIEYED